MLLFVGSSLLMNAADSQDFSYDRTAVDADFSGLEKLETFIQQHPETTLEELRVEKNPLVQDMDMSSGGIMSSLGYGDPPLGIPSFFWGCLLGWVGMLIVYLITEDTDETKKALWGCVTASVGSTLLVVVFYVIYGVFIWSYI